MSDALKDLQKWVNGNSLLIVSIKGILSRLNCPFDVESLTDEFGLQKHHTYQVKRVLIDKQFQLVYQIGEELYPFRYFTIL